MEDKCEGRALPTLMAHKVYGLRNIKVIARCPPGLFGDSIVHSRHLFSHLFAAYVGNWELSWLINCPEMIVALVVKEWVGTE